MKDKKEFEVIIIGGSYAGLSAAMALGRSLRKTLVIDSGKPCNRQTPQAHNFITHDGKEPSVISQIARKQVEEYPTVRFYSGLATNGRQIEDGFEIITQNSDSFKAKKIILATGIKDIMPRIKGFSESWGISIIHCPYCHGYEYRNEKTGIFGNGDYGFEFSKMISNWTDDLTLFTNGKSELDDEQTKKLELNNIKIIEKEIASFENVDGHLKNIVFNDGKKHPIKAVYSQVPFVQHSDISNQLGCELDENGYIKVDMFQKTNVEGLFACGDNTTFMRSIANAVATGTVAGSMSNKELIDEYF
nr:NAD(P)/FAD-dependent oxidoreductase [uncultured Winogradskyella sp.]